MELWPVFTPAASQFDRKTALLPAPRISPRAYLTVYIYRSTLIISGKPEWDENKNKANKRKHGVTFELAVRVYLDDKRIEKLDMEHTTLEEERIHVIGRVSGMLILFVVAT